MGHQTKLTITHDGADLAADLQSKGITAQNGGIQHLNWFQNLLNSIVSKQKNASTVTVIDKGDGVAASGTITLSSFVATDTITVGTQTFTSAASPSGANQFLSTGGDTTVAAAAAAAIAAHTSLTNVVTASAATGVITVTSLVKGLIGNQIGIAISAHGSVSAAKLAGGLEPTGSSSASYSFGI